ncbi:uncharacterized protein PFL1_01961 [Pseudozyma flocculosa PF-1]|uniref:uncharacterized protein n=1 Tax=Pseudozyma flocculosa PF-1 TaxID=1277687 RepID=UPI000455FFDC|nr:uncharacterized protein PFL1_01961 [Pseudozyma flocculosa PF-1]EPQ30435.1 hypothetical protein PFL1_01961 [Pseudozyma flocculosa PF-1]
MAEYEDRLERERERDRLSFGGMPAPYRGKPVEQPARKWLRQFELYCLDRKYDDDGKKALVFKLLMEDDAETWFDGLDASTQASFQALEKAFLSKYGDEAIDGYSFGAFLCFQNKAEELCKYDAIRDKKQWDKLLNELAAADRRVSNKHVVPGFRAEHLVHGLPRAVRQTVALPGTTTNVADVVAAMRKVNHPQLVEAIDEERKIGRIGELERIEELWDYVKRTADKYAEVEVDVDQMRHFWQQSAPVLVPAQRRIGDGSYPSQPNGPSAPYNGVGPSYRPSPPRQRPAPYPPSPTPSPTRPLASLSARERLAVLLRNGQSTHPDTPDGHRIYEQKKAAYQQRHPRTVSRPTTEDEYPLAPGTEPADGTECHRCGHRGHQQASCTGAALSQAEISFRNDLGRDINYALLVSIFQPRSQSSMNNARTSRPFVDPVAMSRPGSKTSLRLRRPSIHFRCQPQFQLPHQFQPLHDRPNRHKHLHRVQFRRPQARGLRLPSRVVPCRLQLQSPSPSRPTLKRRERERKKKKKERRSG